MGCVALRKLEKEERLQICKERKRLMIQLIRIRTQFAAAQMAYLQSLKSTGVTFCQFSDSDCLDADILLPSSPRTLPSSPPPLPPFSSDDVEAEDEEEEIIEGLENIGANSPAPPVSGSSSSWDIRDFFTPSSSSPLHHQKNAEAECWAEINAESNKEDEEENVILSVPRSKKKPLAGIIIGIDYYFLKASESGRDVTLLLDISKGWDSLYGEIMRQSCKSSKVFSALSCGSSSKALVLSTNIVGCYAPSEPCDPGAHGVTLEKIFSEEEKLYKEIKEEEKAKLEYGRKSRLLQKYEDGDQDLKIEEFRLQLDNLQDIICHSQQSTREKSSTIMKLIEKELHPQLIILSSGLMEMWRTMYECHQIQYHISKQINHLTSLSSIKPTTDYHYQSTVQLEAEVSGWHKSFCKLIKSQREYIEVLNRWVHLTDYLADCQQERNCLSIVQQLCEFWKVEMDHLPDKAAAEAIKSLVSLIHYIVLQQAEEHRLQKKSKQLEKKIMKENNSLSETERKFGYRASLSSNHPLAIQRAKLELFKKKVEDEKTKYLNSFQLSRAMTLNNLQISLPNVFQALSLFSCKCTEAFKAIHNHTTTTFANISESVFSESSEIDIR